MEVLSELQGFSILASFTLLMLIATVWYSRNFRNSDDKDNFHLASRNVSWWLGAPSIAASWLWAPALFVSVQKSYELGVAGLFWFTIPNVFALAIFSLLAPQIRSKMPDGVTLPSWMLYKLKSKLLHKVYLIPFVWYQLMAICVQIFVGGMLLEFLTNIPLHLCMVLLCTCTLSYSLISGLRASLVTDLIQIIFIFGVGVIIIPMAISSAGGFHSVAAGFGGLANNLNVFDPQIAFSFGVVTSIGLIAGAVSDQQYWQRSFAIKKDDLRMSFLLGALIFGVVPIGLSVLGFLAANQELGINLPDGTGLPMIGVATVVELLPETATLMFVVMLLAGLFSTLDSGLCAAASIYATDIMRKDGLSEPQIISKSRIAMICFAFLGLVLALIVQYFFSLDRLWWIFNGVATCFVVPTILSLFWNRLTAKGVIVGIIIALFGMLLFVYGNWIKNDEITVYSAVFILFSSLASCLFFKSKKENTNE